MTTVDLEEQVSLELTRFSAVVEDMTTNVLDWWRAHVKEFPYLAISAQRRLGVPAAQVSCERFFSLAVEIVTKTRAGAEDRVRPCIGLNEFIHRRLGALRDAGKGILLVSVELDEMLADPSVDVVTICTPSGSHREPAVAAAKAKILGI